MGPPRRARRGDGRRRLPARRRARATPSPGCRRRAEDLHGVPCRHRASKAASWSPAAGACCASLRWARRSSTAQQRAYEALHGIHIRRRAVTAPTSATAPSSDDSEHRPRQKPSTAPRCATTCSACSSASSTRFAGRGRQALHQRRLDARAGRRAGGRRPVAPGRRQGNVLERGGCNFSHVTGQDAAAVGHAAPARAGRRALRGDGRVAGLPPAQPATCRRCT